MESLAVEKRGLTFPEFEDFILSDGCKHVGGPQYCRALYTFAEAAQAKEILECGLGWGYSGLAFSASMSSREGGRLTSLDPFEPRGAISKPHGVLWNHVYTSSREYTHDAPEIDLLYVDGDPASVYEDVLRFRDLVKTRGLIVIDGYGGQKPVTQAVQKLAKEGMRFGMVPYTEQYAHAVMMVTR